MPHDLHTRVFQEPQDTVLGPPVRPPTHLRKAPRLPLSVYDREVWEVLKSPFVRETLNVILGPLFTPKTSELYFSPLGLGTAAVAEPASEEGEAFISYGPLMRLLPLNVEGEVVPPLITFRSEDSTPWPSRTAVHAHEVGHSFQFKAERLPKGHEARRLLEEVLKKQTRLDKAYAGRWESEEAFADAFATAGLLLRFPEKADSIAKSFGEKYGLKGIKPLLDYMRRKQAAAQKERTRVAIRDDLLQPQAEERPILSKIPRY